jgi:membrane peptidoglycan carboxypeptidase
VFVVFVLGMFGTYEYMSSSATIPAAATSATVQNTTVYYSDGKTILGTIGTTNRQDLNYNQIPMSLQNAVVSAEDKGFWTEGGISPTGILRAAIHDVTSGGSSLNGGSTITQEFVRNYYDGIGTQQTASRKIKEIFIAQKVASTYSKQWIMQHYLNTIYMGDGANGMQAAAETYFGVPAEKLTVSQSAVLAGMIQQPSTYYLPSNRANLKARWQYVISQMVKNGYLTQAEANAQVFPAKLTSDTTKGASSAGVRANSSDPWAPYLLTQVEDELSKNDGITQQELSTNGYKVVTTISHSMEVKLYRAVNENTSDSAIANIGGGAATVKSLPPWLLIGAELQDPATGQILAEYPGKGQTPGCGHSCFVNTASVSANPVGSSFKPYVLSTAVNQGMNVLSSQLNTSPFMCIAPVGSAQFSQPITQAQYTTDNMQKTPDCTAQGLTGSYPVQNDGGETIGKKVGQQTKGTFKGAQYWSANALDAMAYSSNTGFTDLAHKTGTQQIIDLAGQFGVNKAELQSANGEAGLALGIQSMTVQEQTSMIATLADNGLYHQAHIVKYWQHAGVGQAPQTPKVQSHQVLTPQQAGDVQYAMEGTTTLQGATATGHVTYGAQTPGVVIGKTGTTTGSKQGFFIGATTKYALVVGMFVDQPGAKENVNNSLASLGGGGFGGTYPANIWNSMAMATFPQNPTTFTTTPDTTGQQQWNLLGTVPKAPKKCDQQNQPGGKHHKNSQNQGQNCPPNQQQGNNGSDTGGQNGTPNPTVTCDPNSDPNCQLNSDGTVTCDPNSDPNCQTVSTPSATPTATVTCDPNVDHSCQVNSDGTVTCDPTADPDCTTVTSNNSTSGVRATPVVPATGTLGGMVLLLPGTLLTRVTRRRKRRDRARKAE